MAFDTFRHQLFGGMKVLHGTAAPTATDEAFAVGDLVINSAPSNTSPFGWVCTVAGSPGTWVAINRLADTSYTTIGATTLTGSAAHDNIAATPTSSAALVNLPAASAIPVPLRQQRTPRWASPRLRAMRPPRP